MGAVAPNPRTPAPAQATTSPSGHSRHSSPGGQAAKAETAYPLTCRALSAGTASRNSGAVQPCRANVAVTASLTGPEPAPLAAAGTRASTDPPNPPPIIRAP